MQTTELLVIGYGNTLRGDDGVGPRVAEGIDSLRLPGVRTLTCQQLSPEYADPISQADTVIFVDAAVDAPKEVQLRPLEPNESSQLMAHAADPRTMLALARDVFGHAPRAWWLTIPAESLEFSETLSSEAQRGMAEAVDKIRSLCCPLQVNRPDSKKCKDSANASEAFPIGAKSKWLQFGGVGSAVSEHTAGRDGEVPYDESQMPTGYEFDHALEL